MKYMSTIYIIKKNNRNSRKRRGNQRNKRQRLRIRYEREMSVHILVYVKCAYKEVCLGNGSLAGCMAVWSH